MNKMAQLILPHPSHNANKLQVSLAEYYHLCLEISPMYTAV